MSFEGYRFVPSAPEADPKIMQTPARELEIADWSEEYGALISRVEPTEEGKKIAIHFFENSREPVVVNADAMLQIRRGAHNF